MNDSLKRLTVDTRGFFYIYMSDSEEDLEFTTEE